MKGPHAICPESGARLSQERHPDERRIQYREPTTSESSVLSTGKTHSSMHALASFFGRKARDLVDDPEEALLTAASQYLRALKSETDARDEWVWYALCERLHRDGYDVAWMRMADVVLVCPHCGSRLTYRPAPKGDILPKCAINCQGSDDFVYGAIRSEIRTAYNQAFDDGELERGDLQITA